MGLLWLRVEWLFVMNVGRGTEMIKREKEEIAAKVKELFRTSAVWVGFMPGGEICIQAYAEGNFPGRDLKKLIELGEFLGTFNIEDGEVLHTSGGCDTCDYGEKFGFELICKEEESGTK